MRKNLIQTVFALLGVTLGFAAEDISELEAVLEQTTQVATKSKVNADYVPGMLTIVHGDEMEALGAQTVLEALAFVPGVQIFKERNGQPNLVVRGITYPFNNGNTKVLINSIPVSRDFAGVNSAALLMRIEQVDRIEFTRGPSSGVHGAFAFQGVINIITRANQSRAFAAAATDEMRTAGVIHTFVDGKSRLTVNGSAARGADNEGTRGVDPEASQSTNVMQFERDGFVFSYMGIQRGQTLQAQFAPGRTDTFEHSHTFDVRKRFQYSKRLDAEVAMIYQNTDAFTGELGKQFRGDRLDARAELHWRPNDTHNVLVHLEGARDNLDLGTTFVPAGANLPLPLLALNSRGASRRIHAASVQDQVDLTRKLTLTAGVRADFYSDVGSVATPRVALVYRANERDIVKAQYAQGFRPPAFFEQLAPGFNDDSLDFEVIGTTELGFVRQGKRATRRITFFYSQMREVLFPILPPVVLPTSVNNDEAIHSHGAELEWSSKLTDRLRAMANLSLVNTHDSRLTSGPQGDSATAADVLGNLGAVWTPTRDFSLGGRLRVAGDRHVIGGKAQGYQTFDLTATAFRWPGKEWTTRVGGKNVFNDRVIYLEALPGFTDRSDFEPRMTWARVSRDF